MSNTDVARTVMEAIEAQDWATVKAHLTNDFVFEGPVPQPINKDQWLGLQMAMANGIPDWSFNISAYQEKGNVVQVTVQISGTQTNVLDLSPMGMPVLPASGIHIQNPVERVDLTIKGDKVASVHVDPVPGGGVAGILAQLGVPMPH